MQTSPQTIAKILLADDSKVMRRAFGKILREQYDMLEAEDGEQAWLLLNAHADIELLISDLEMPGLDGFGLLDRMRNSDDQRIKELPVIVITGAEDDKTKERALIAGANDFVIKPVDREQLLERTQAQLEATESEPISIEPVEESPMTEDEALLDPQTGLAIRRYFMQRCEQDISAAMRHQEQMSLMRINIDNYKKVYEQVGDDGYEELLTWVSKILLDTARTEDTVSRVGGAEFAVLAPKTDKQGGLIFAERLQLATTAKPFTHDSNSVPITLSIGVVTIGVDQEIEVDGILKLAEERVEAARVAGGNCINNGDQIMNKAGPATGTASVEPVLISDTTPVSATAGIYIDQALEMLARNETEELDPYLADLLLQVMPLLEYGNKSLNLSLGFAMNAMRERLEAIKADDYLAKSST